MRKVMLLTALRSYIDDLHHYWTSIFVNMCVFIRKQKKYLYNA